MSNRKALLNAIAANPADRTVRLVYADWLDENDEPDRAEFIRLQIRRAENKVRKASAREKELWDAHHEEWFPGYGKQQVTRGFVHDLKLFTNPELLDQHHAFLKREPVRTLSLLNCNHRSGLNYAPEQYYHPALREVHGVFLDMWDVGRAYLEGHLKNPYLAGIKELRIYAGSFSTLLSSEIVPALLQHAANLQELQDLHYNTRDNAHGAAVVDFETELTHATETALKADPPRAIPFPNLLHINGKKISPKLAELHERARGLGLDKPEPNTDLQNVGHITPSAAAPGAAATP